jgi:glycosyltransferase involved in cell wall biosynthesis
MLVSVCLPTFNGKEFVRQAIDSVLAQSYAQFELIVVDDCSQDGTYEIVQEIAASRPPRKIRCYRNHSRAGLFANYNACISQASGELIKPFAQDDLLKENALAEMVSAFERERGVVMVCTGREGGDLYSPDGKDVSEESLPPGRTDGKSVILSCLHSYRNLIGEPVAVMFDAKLKDLQFDTQYASLGDLDCWFRILQHGDLFHIDTPLVTFRQHLDSTTMALLKNLDWVVDFFRLSRQYNNYLEQLGITRDAYCMGFTELAGSFIDKMVKDGKLKMDDLDGFREVAFYSMLRCSQLSFKSREYDSVMASTSWRITEPLRSLMRMIGRAPAQQSRP